MSKIKRENKAEHKLYFSHYRGGRRGEWGGEFVLLWVGLHLNLTPPANEEALALKPHRDQVLVYGRRQSWGRLGGAQANHSLNKQLVYTFMNNAKAP